MLLEDVVEAVSEVGDGEDGEGIEEGRGVGETMDSGGIVVGSVHGRGWSGEWAGEMEGREEEK